MFVWPSELRISRDTSLIMPRNYNFGYFYFGYFYFGQVSLFWQGISILAISILAIIILAIFRVIFSSSNYLFCWYNRGLQLLRNLLFSSTYKEVSLLFMYYLFKCLFFLLGHLEQWPRWNFNWRQIGFVWCSPIHRKDWRSKDRNRRTMENCCQSNRWVQGCFIDVSNWFFSS